MKVTPEAASDDDVAAAQRGDEVAFTRLYRTVQPGLMAYATVIAGSDAEDVCAEAWAQACRDLAKFKGGIDGFRGWIARIARNRLLDLRRAQGRRPADPMAPADLPDLAAQPSAESEALTDLSTRRALAAIATLPLDQAEAIVLRVVMGLDAKAAGDVVGKRAGAIRTAAYRGLRTLADKLDD